MKIGIMQPYFFPYVGYWQLIKAVDRFVLYDDVNFIPRGWINRNRILLNGKAHLFTLPVCDLSQFKKINATCLAPDAVARGKLFKTLEHAYKKAPYFSDVMTLIGYCLENCGSNIACINAQSILAVCSYLGLATSLALSSSLPKEPGDTAQQGIINIVKSMGGDSYVNAAGGQHLYSKDAFAKQGLELRFIHMKSICYRQFGKEFVPGLSIIDALMFNSREEVRVMLDAYELV
jgi:hypothetical protein